MDGPTCETAESCAQRLSASKRDSPGSSKVASMSHASAQRLSASKRDSPVLRGQGGCWFQQCSTPFGIKEGFTRAAQCVSCCSKHPKCSTPFGIKEGFTSSQTIGCCSTRACSTPFGIKEGFTRQPGMNCPPCMLCSTPFGIKEGFTRRDVVLRAFRTQCSTPFGIKEGFTLLHGCRKSNADKLCSTPFGIKEGFTLDNVVCRCSYSSVLNAFRHQRGIHSTRVTICFLKTNIPVYHVLLRICYMSPSHYTAQRNKC